MFGEKLGSEKQIRKFAGHIARNYGALTADKILFSNINHPIIVRGNSGGWFTRRGDHIYHPNAYSKIGWSNMVYRRREPTTVILPYNLINWEKI